MLLAAHWSPSFAKPAPSTEGTLRIRLVDGRELPITSSERLSDPFVSLSVGSEQQQSKVVAKSINPKWDERFVFRGSF